MLFTAKIVEERPAGNVMIGIAITSIFFILIGILVQELNSLVPFFFCTLLVCIVIMAILTKGDLSSYKLVNDLQIFVDGMQISHWVYPFREINELIFEFQSYEKVTTDYRGRRNFESYGLGNNVSFVYKNQPFHYQFHLHSLQHYRAFVAMLEVLYENGVSFSERNLNGPTFLMRNVNEDQLLMLRKQYQQIR